MSITVEDYVELLAGRNNRGSYSRDYVYINTKEKPTKAKVLLNEKIGLPANLNASYDLTLGEKTKGPKKNKIKLNSDLLALLHGE